jgi:hypothetical protein
MSYDKSPAIIKAVAILEEAGMEVRVLNTGVAKLADFLGALAGNDSEEDAPAAEPKMEEPAMEAVTIDTPILTEQITLFVDDEKIAVQLIDGPSELYPNGLMIGSKTAYAINESHFAFWPARDEDNFVLSHTVELKLNDHFVIEEVLIKEAQAIPMLKLNKQVYEKMLGN